MSCRGARLESRSIRSRRQIGAEGGLRGELLREQAGVLLRPARMTAGLGVSDFGQRQQRLHHQALGRGLVAAGAVCPPPLDRELRERHDRERAPERRASGTAAT